MWFGRQNRGGGFGAVRGGSMLPVVPGGLRSGGRLGRGLGGKVGVRDRMYWAGQRPGRRSEIEGAVLALRTRAGRLVGG